MLIVLIGPDGCGKTTIANEIVKKFNMSFREKKIYEMHFRILPSFRQIINPLLKNKIKNKYFEGEKNAGMKEKVNSMSKSMIYIIWYFFDYFLGNLIVMRAYFKNDLLVFTRYFYDYYYQRTHKNAPLLLLNFLCYFVPRPTFIFTLKRDPYQIHNDKPELTVDEIKSQQFKIDKLFSKNKNFYVIDSNQGIEKTVEKIFKIINDEK